MKTTIFIAALLIGSLAMAWSQSNFSGTITEDGNYSDSGDSGYSNSGSGYISDDTAETTSPSSAYRLMEMARQEAKSYLGSGAAGLMLQKTYESFLQANPKSELSLEEYAQALLQ